MADQQITDLPVVTALDDADLLLTRQGSTDKQVTKAVAFAQHLKSSNNLSDIPNAGTARTNLDVPQIGATVLRANNLSDLASASTSRTNLGVAIGSNVQAWSAQLDAVSANNTTTGFVSQTGTNTVASRTLTAPAAGLTIANPTGSGGNPTFALANDLSGLEGLSSNGIAVRTATDTWAVRTLTGAAAGISVTNGDGVAGNPTLVLANDLSALEALSSTGIAVRSASDTWVQRTITGTANQIVVADGSGVSGNPTLTLPAQIILPSHATAGSVSMREASGNGTSALKIEAADSMASDMTLKMFSALPAKANPVRVDASGNVTVSNPTMYYKGDANGGTTSLITVADPTVESILIKYHVNGGGLTNNTNNTSWGLQFYESGAYITSNTYNFVWNGINNSGTIMANSATSQNKFLIIPAVSGDYYTALYLEIVISKNFISGKVDFYNGNASVMASANFWGYNSAASLPVGFRMINSGGTLINSGSIPVYSLYQN